MRGRFYSPAWHRFLNSDQGADQFSPNQFAYCGGSPMMATDPTGMMMLMVGDNPHQCYLAGGNYYDLPFAYDAQNAGAYINPFANATHGGQLFADVMAAYYAGLAGKGQSQTGQSTGYSGLGIGPAGSIQGINIPDSGSSASSAPSAYATYDLGGNFLGYQVEDIHGYDFSPDTTYVAGGLDNPVNQAVYWGMHGVACVFGCGRFFTTKTGVVMSGSAAINEQLSAGQDLASAATGTVYMPAASATAGQGVVTGTAVGNTMQTGAWSSYWGGWGDWVTCRPKWLGGTGPVTP